MLKKMEKSTIKTHFKARGLIIFMLCLLLVTPIISADLHFDNIKGDLIIDETTSKYGKVEIKDWFGLLDLATLELKENTDTCGTSCSMETEIIMYQDGVLIDAVKFIGYQVKDYQFYVQTGTKETGKIINDYEIVCSVYSNKTGEGETCEYEIIGTHPETEPIWSIYNIGDEVIAGTYYVKLEGTKDFYSATDWIIKTQGKEITEWADWGVGGTITTVDGETVHTYLTSGYFNVTADTRDVKVLVVAGGGQGGSGNPGGGGGAGGLIYEASFEVTPGDYPVIVGVGGTGVTTIVGGDNGDNSSFSTLHARGGGGGGNAGNTTTNNGKHGGSGGGSMGAFGQIKTFIGGKAQPIGQGYPGGNVTNPTNSRSTAGGGGAGEPGESVNGQNLAGDGGDGSQYDINGTARYYAGGGGGAGYPSGYGDGGLGGGGRGREEGGDACQHGSVNTGGGGGGGDTGCNGGTGIVIIRYSNATIVSTVTTTLNSPEDYYNSTTSSIEFNCSAETDGIDGAVLTNITLWLNQTGTWILNETKTITGAYNNSIFTKNIVEGINWEWTCVAYDNNSAYDWGTNRTLTVDTIDPILLASVTNPIIYTDGDDVRVQYNVTDINLQSCWYNYDGTNTSFYCLSGVNNFTNITSSSPETAIIIYVNDSVGNQVSKSLSFSFDSTAPTIIINEPTTTEDYGYAGKTETLNWTIVDTNFASVWYNYNGTNYTKLGAINTTTFYLQTSPFNLTVWANDSLGNQNSATTTWSYRLFKISEEYTNSTLSGVINPFVLNLQTNGTAITLAYLIYNGTSYLGTINSTSNIYSLTKNQIATTVSAETNISFYWNITMSDGFNKLITTKNQTVKPITINETCTGRYTIFNFTLVDEINQGKLNANPQNTSIKVNLDLYSSDRSLQLLNYFHEFSEINPAGICIGDDLSSNEEYSLDIQIEYTALGYSNEFYNIERYVLNSSTLNNNITLYDLNTTDTQKFKLIVRDTSYLPINGALVKIERKYLENGTYYITEIPKTDEKGITSASLQVNDVIYNFYIYESGILISSFTNVLAICQTPLISQCEIDFNAFQSEITIPDFETGDDFNFTLDYNSSSKVITSQFIIPSGSPSLVQLVVTREDSLGTAVCSNSLTSASGTLSCTIPSSFGNSTVMAKIYKDSVEQGKGNIKLDQSSSDIFGVILVLLSVFVIITLIGVGVSDNPVVTAVFIFIGVILLFGINLVQNTGFIGATATILFLGIAIVLVIIKAARRS